jgi:hypothetical protein
MLMMAVGLPLALSFLLNRQRRDWIGGAASGALLVASLVLCAHINARGVIEWDMRVDDRDWLMWAFVLVPLHAGAMLIGRDELRR